MRKLLSAVVAGLILVAGSVAAQDDFAVPPPPQKEDFFKPGLAPVSARPGADVTIVYFMDYQCPACRKYTPDVSAVFAADRKLKVIYRDTPIFGPRSVEAAKYAIASQFQGKHDAFHRALMAQPLPLDEAAIKAAAAKAGVDWPRLQKDRAARARQIEAQIAQNDNLSEAAGISGTPAFIIGESLADGALDAAGLRAEIADARAARAKGDPPPAEATVQGPGPAASEAEPQQAATDPKPAVEPSPVKADRPKDAPMFERSQNGNLADQEAGPGSGVWLLPALGAAAILALALLAIFVRRRRRNH